MSAGAARDGRVGRRVRRERGVPTHRHDRRAVRALEARGRGGPVPGNEKVQTPVAAAHHHAGRKAKQRRDTHNNAKHDQGKC